MSEGIKPLDWLRDAIDDDRLTTTDRAAVAGILRFAPGRPRPAKDWPHGAASPWDFHLSQEALREFINAGSIKTAERCFAHLRELGYLTQVTRGRGAGRRPGDSGRATVWRISLPATRHESPDANRTQPDTGVCMQGAEGIQ